MATWFESKGQPDAVGNDRGRLVVPRERVIGLVWVQADIDIRAEVMRGLWVDAGCTATLIWNLTVYVYSIADRDMYGLDNRGTIAGDARLTLTASNNADLCHNNGRIATPLTLTAVEETTSSPVYVMPSDAVLEDVRITSPGDVPIIVDLSGNTMATSSIYLDHGHIGNGTLITSSWDSTAGTILDGTSLILSDGGTITLAPGQAFDRLEIASDDGRTASWTMNATGTVSPIVTGLKSGSYLWYLDGVEQGEVKADKSGTIALSYVSTGPHTLEVKPTSMTVAMDGLAAAIGSIWRWRCRRVLGWSARRRWLSSKPPFFCPPRHVARRPPWDHMGNIFAEYKDAKKN